MGSGRTLSRALESFPASLHRILTSRYAILCVASFTPAYCRRLHDAVQSDLRGLSPEASRLSQVANVTWTANLNPIACLAPGGD